MDGGQIGKLTVFDISKSGEQIGEKLFALLNPKQQQELIQYVLTKEEREGSVVSTSGRMLPIPSIEAGSRLTEVQAEDLYFCLENRMSYICKTEILLTVKEFCF